MIQHDRGALFFGLILPHGLLELTAVFVAAGVGLRLFWSWVEPGAAPGLQSLAHEGRSAAAVALGLVLVLLVSGVIEAFVTPVRAADLGPHRRSGCWPRRRSSATSSCPAAGPPRRPHRRRSPPTPLEDQASRHRHSLSASGYSSPRPLSIR